MSKRWPDEDLTRYLTGPAYGVALLFAVLPFVDVIAQVWPITLDSASWRYGSIGIGANYLISVLFGLLMLGYLAARGQHRRGLLLLAVVCGLGAVLAVVGSLGFALDALQIRGTVPRDPPRTRWMFDVGVAKAVVKYMLGAVAMAWMTLAAWKARRAIPTAAAEDEHFLVGKK